MNTSGSVFSSSRIIRRRNTWSCSRNISTIRSATRSSRAKWVGRSLLMAKRLERRSRRAPGGGIGRRRGRGRCAAAQRHIARDSFEDHGLYRAAFALTIWIDQLFDRTPSLQNEPAAVKLATHSALASAKLAAALSDDDVDEIGMTIAYLKRALKAITVSMDAAAQLLAEKRITAATTCRSCSSGSSRCATESSLSWANTAANGCAASAVSSKRVE